MTESPRYASKTAAGPAQAASSLTGRTLHGLLWQFGGTGGKGILQIGFLTILARLIAPEEFGIVAAAMVVVGLSSLFSQFGVGPALVHQPTLRTEHVRVAFTITVLFSAAAVVVVWATAPLVAHFFRMPDLERVLVVISTVFLLAGLGVVAESLLQRSLEFRKLANVDLASYAIGYGAVGVVLGYLGYGYWALVGGHVAQAMVKTAALISYRPHPIRPTTDVTAMKQLIRYGGGHTLAKFGNYAAAQCDNIVVGKVIGAAALGVYGRAYTLLVMPAQLFGTVLDRVLFPAMASIQHERPRLARVYRRGLAAIALVTLPASGIAFVLSPELVLLILGSEWRATAAPFQLLALGIMFRTSYKISDSLVRATGNVYRRAWRQAVYAALVFAGALTGTVWGLQGVAAGVLFAIVANFVLMAHLGLAITGLSTADFIKAHLPGLRLATVATLLTFAAASVLRALQAPPAIVILVVLLLVVTSTRSVLLVYWSDFFLGSDGIWIRATAQRHLLPVLLAARSHRWRVS